MHGSLQWETWRMHQWQYQGTDVEHSGPQLQTDTEKEMSFFEHTMSGGHSCADLVQCLFNP